MTLPPGTELVREEVVETFTPLGLQLWDQVADLPMPGLRVEARARGGGKVSGAFTTPSAVYGFRNIVDLGLEFDPPVDVLDQVATLSASQEIIVAAIDPLGRFLPMVLAAPAPVVGLLTAADVQATSVPSGTRIYLFSSPSRTLPTGTAAVRATLAANDDSPLPFALVMVSDPADPADRFGIGVSDERGEVVVPIPYPVFGGALPGSSVSGTSGTPLEVQSWPLRIEIRSDRAALDFVPGMPARAGEWPTLASLFDQPMRDVVDRVGDPAVSFLQRQLEFGRDLVVRTINHPDALTVVDIAP